MGDLPSFGVRAISDGALAAPTYINAVKLAANTAVTVTPTTDAKIVVFRPKFEDTVFYCRFDGSAASEPTGTVSDGTASEPNPRAREISGVATFSIISPQNDAIVLMLFFGDEAETVLGQ